MNLRFLLFSVLFSSLLSAQTIDYTWWNNKHNWDGITPWNYYIDVQTGKMGPNAIPVPELRNGLMDTSYSVMLSGELHTMPGEVTINAFMEVNIPIKKAVQMQVFWYPVEYFKTDTNVRDFRAARTREAEGWATGDLYICTVIPIVKDHDKWPEILLGINLKTATGNRLHDARFTDGAGYYFDVSFGKSYALNKGGTIRLYGMGGFYVYQTTSHVYVQNDAIMWGVGVDLQKWENWIFRAQLTGYHGYFRELDQPIVFRAEVQRSINKHFRALLRYQGGNESYPWTSFRLGCYYIF